MALMLSSYTLSLMFLLLLATIYIYIYIFITNGANYVMIHNKLFFHFLYYKTFSLFFVSFFDFPEFHKNLRMIIELWRNHLDQIRNYHFLGSLYTNSTCSKHVIHAIWQVTTMPIMRFHDLKIEIRLYIM